jgi:hypothetical protein
VKKNTALHSYVLQRVHICEDNSIKYLIGKLFSVTELREVRSGDFIEVKASPSFDITMKFAYHGTKISFDYEMFAIPAAFGTDNTSYVFYNDLENNLDHTDSDKFSLFSDSEIKNKARPCYTYFSKDGNAGHKVLLPSYKSIQKILLQSAYTLVKDHELLMPITLGDRVALMKISFE